MLLGGVLGGVLRPPAVDAGVVWCGQLGLGKAWQACMPIPAVGAVATGGVSCPSRGAAAIQSGLC